MSEFLKDGVSTFTLLLGWRSLLILLLVTSFPLHPLPAAEHVIVLISGDLLWVFILRKDAWEEKPGRDEVRDQQPWFCVSKREQTCDRRFLPSLRSRSLSFSTGHSQREEEEETNVSLDSGRNDSWSEMTDGWNNVCDHSLELPPTSPDLKNHFYQSCETFNAEFIFPAARAWK